MKVDTVLFVAQERLTQVSGHLAGSKSAPGGREKLLEKNPDDVSVLLSQILVQ